jgi:cysteine desulfurase
MIYLDYAATTPVDPRVAASMQQCLTLDGCFGNPASNTHEFGFAATAMVESAREQIAQTLNAQPREIIFTSGATEADNLAIKGLAQFHRQRRQHIITVATSHKAVLDSCAALEKDGFSVSYLKPQANGVLALDDLHAAITPNTLLISIMHVNNETGVIHDIAAITDMAKQHGIYVHVDAAQSFGKLVLDVTQLPADLISLSAHKIYGPKGIGALYVRQTPRVRLQEQISGGKHERGLRSGTLPTHQITGLSAAAVLMQENGAAEQTRIEGLQQQFLSALKDLPAWQINGDPQQKLPNIVNLQFDHIDSEALMASCPELAFSAGSACTSATMAPSHVLSAMGLTNQQANSSVRISFGRFTTEADIVIATDTLKQQVTRLRDLSPLWSAP